MYEQLEMNMYDDIASRIESLPSCSAENLLMGISVCDDDIQVKYPSNVYINTSVNIKKVGGDSMFGKVVLMEIEGIMDSYILKSSYNSNVSKETLDREIVIALFGINKLHKFTPNFPKSYGFFSCGPIINNKIMCENTKVKTKYFIQEYVKNSITYRQFLSDRNIDYEKLISVLFQIYISLYIGYENIKFTHNDLHEENILIQKLDERMTLEYVVSGKKIYHSTNILVKIIDFGYSTMIIDGVEYVSSFVHNNNIVKIDSNTSPIVDIFKLDFPKNDNLKLPFMRNIFSFLPKDLVYSDVYFIEDFNNEKLFITFMNKFFNDLPVDFYMYKNTHEFPLMKCYKNCDPESIINSLSNIFRSETYPNTLAEYDFIITQGYKINQISSKKLDSLLQKHAEEIEMIRKKINKYINFISGRNLDSKFIEKYKLLLTYLPLYIDMIYLMSKYNSNYIEDYEIIRKSVKANYNNYREIFEMIKDKNLIEKTVLKTHNISNVKMSTIQSQKIKDDYISIISQLSILKKSLSENRS